MPIDAQVCALADRFADAAIDGSQWMPALAALAEATGSDHGQLIGIGGAATIPFNWVTDFPDRALSEFVTIDGGSPLVNPRVAVSLDAPVLGLRSEADYRAARPSLRNDDYLDFCADHDIPNGCQTKLVEDGNGLVGLAVLRSGRRRPTSAAQRRLFAAVAPHVRSAVRLQTALEAEGLRLMRGALDQVGAAVFVCDAGGRVRASTAAAEAILLDGRLALIDGHLAARAGRDTEALRRAVAAQAAARSAAPYEAARRPLETVVLRAPPGELPVILDVCAAPGQPARLHFQARVLVIVRGERRWREAAAPLLATLFGLSGAEADVALRLARGEGRAAIAEARSATVETVRAQLKSVFGKLGVNREVELAAMLGDLMRL